MIQKFYKKYPNARVYIQYGSSGYLTDAILEGKSYDIYFSANIKYPQKVYEAQKSATKPKLYAQGSLILFVPSNPRLAKEKIRILHSKSIQHITIANTTNTIYGERAIEVLKNSKFYKSISKKIQYSLDITTVIGEVIWNKSAGFLPKSALYMIPDGRKKEGVNWIEIDKNLYTPILQAYTISEHGLKNENAMKFLHFIESKAGQKIFKENGYKVLYHVSMPNANYIK